MTRLNARAIRAVSPNKAGRGRAKYNNTKTELDGHTFDSKAEAKRYGELKYMLAAGEIKGFSLQPSFLLPGGVRYRPDFLVCDAQGHMWVEDVKGMEI